MHGTGEHVKVGPNAISFFLRGAFAALLIKKFDTLDKAVLPPSGDEITTFGAEAYKHFDGNGNNQLGMTEFVCGVGALVKLSRKCDEVLSASQLGALSCLVRLLHARS